MPLNENPKPKFTKNFSHILKRGAESFKNQAVDVIFVILIVANFFTRINLILGIFMILYFIDKWKLYNLLNKEQHYDSNNKYTGKGNE